MAAEPTEFQRRILDALTAHHFVSMNLTELAARLKSNRLAVHSAARSLERSGWAVIIRSDNSQWAVKMVCISNAWRKRIAADGVSGTEKLAAYDEMLAALEHVASGKSGYLNKVKSAIASAKRADGVGASDGKVDCTQSPMGEGGGVEG